MTYSKIEDLNRYKGNNVNNFFVQDTVRNVLCCTKKILIIKNMC